MDNFIDTTNIEGRFEHSEWVRAYGKYLDEQLEVYQRINFYQVGPPGSLILTGPSHSLLLCTFRSASGVMDDDLILVCLPKVFFLHHFEAHSTLARMPSCVQALVPKLHNMPPARMLQHPQRQEQEHSRDQPCLRKRCNTTAAQTALYLLTSSVFDCRNKNTVESSLAYEACRAQTCCFRCHSYRGCCSTCWTASPLVQLRMMLLFRQAAGTWNTLHF